MKAIDLLSNLKRFAEEYKKEAISSINRNNHMNDIKKTDLLDQKHIDAVLVDFINYIGTNHGVDFGLYTKDL